MAVGQSHPVFQLDILEEIILIGQLGDFSRKSPNFLSHFFLSTDVLTLYFPTRKKFNALKNGLFYHVILY